MINVRYQIENLQKGRARAKACTQPFVRKGLMGYQKSGLRELRESVRDARNGRNEFSNLNIGQQTQERLGTPFLLIRFPIGEF